MGSRAPKPIKSAAKTFKFLCIENLHIRTGLKANQRPWHLAGEAAVLINLDQCAKWPHHV
jgi:hypothetical protein